MKIAVVCANGKAGQLIVKEALSRHLDVTAIMRGENKSEASQVITKDLFNLATADLKGFDVVIDAFGAWTEETLPLHSTSLMKRFVKCFFELLTQNFSARRETGRKRGAKRACERLEAVFVGR